MRCYAPFGLACLFLVGCSSSKPEPEPAAVQAPPEKDGTAVALEQALAMGEHALEVKDYGKAIERFSVAIRLDPANVTALRGRGEAYLHKGMLTEGIKDLAGVASREPKNDKAQKKVAGAYFLRARKHLAAGASAAAIADFNAAMEYMPGEAALYYLRGRCYFESGEKGKAAADFRKAVALDPGVKAEIAKQVPDFQWPEDAVTEAQRQYDLLLSAAWRTRMAFPESPDKVRWPALAKVNAYQNEVFALPVLGEGTFEQALGQVGMTFRSGSESVVRVLQVAGKKEAHVRFYDEGQRIALRGLPTDRMIDGRDYTLPPAHVFKVAGTVQYKTVAGGTNTIPVLEVIPGPKRPTDAEYSQALKEASQVRLNQDAARREEDSRRSRAEEAEAAQMKAKAKAKTEREAPAKAAAEAKKAEAAAAAKLSVAKDGLRATGDGFNYRQRLKALVKQYPDTKAAEEARRLLKE